MRRISLWLLITALLLHARGAGAQQPDSSSLLQAQNPPRAVQDQGSAGREKPAGYFYHGYGYGSESLVNPITLILHGGYGIMAMENRSNKPFDFPYKTGWENLWHNLAHPAAAIDAYGWVDFITGEIIPFSVNSKNAQYWPNYTMHLLGGGMSSRMMTEWFANHRYSHPRFFSLATITIYHMLNEVVENGDFRGYTVDPIADLYIFDPLSVVLFSNDRVARFFSQSLNYADWSYQLSFDPWRGTIQNNGQNFSMKWRLPWSQKWHLFYNYGNHGEAGFSYKLDQEKAVSFGAGLVAKNLVGVDGKDRSDLRSLTTDLVTTAGLFYDRNNSLMASVLYAGKLKSMLRVNVYPGLLHIGCFSPGLFALLDRDDRWTMGVQVQKLPIGLARRF
jgi:hypothetical protein